MAIGKKGAHGGMIAIDGGSDETGMGDITSDIISYNKAISSEGSAVGGFLYNYGKVGNITGSLIGNEALGHTGANGGATAGPIKELTAEYISNNRAVTENGNAQGGALQSVIAQVDSVTVNDNQAISNQGKAYGGFLYNVWSNNIRSVTGNILNNEARGYSEAAGGGIYNASYRGTGSIGKISGMMAGNKAVSEIGNAYGGAIYNGKIGQITGDFLNNYAQTASETNKAYGGAVYAAANMNFVSGADVHFMSGNYTKDPTRGKNYNALYVTGYYSTIAFDTAGGGAWVINDNIEGGSYVFKGNDTIDAETGTTTQYVAMNNDIVNAEKVTVENTTLRFDVYRHEDQTAKNWDGKGAFVASLNEDGTANRDAAAVTSLSLNNAVFDIANGYLETVKLKGYVFDAEVPETTI